MKKTRLLEIIREEITAALSETMTKEKSPKYKELAKKYQLDEEIINEMASIKQLKTQLEKQGKEKELSAIKDTEKTVLDTLKKDPTITSDGRLKGYVSAFKKELKASHGIGLQDLLTTVMLDAEEAGDKFKDDIATNTIEKDAANQLTGKEAGQRGRKPSEKKEEEPKAKKEKEEKPKKEKPEPKSKSKEKDEEGDEEFEKLEKAEKEFYSSEEEPEQTEKAPVGDKGTEQKARKQDKVIKAYKEIESEMKDKIQKAKTGDKTAMDWLKEKQPIIKAYNALKKVGI